MIEQLSLSVGLARATDPGTSAQAARTITGRSERLILQHLEAAQANPRYANDFTDDELCERLPMMYPPTLKSARSRLSNKGLLVDSGERRKSQRGCDQIVWRLA